MKGGVYRILTFQSCKSGRFSYKYDEEGTEYEMEF